jgi:hypothetical protein
MGEQRGAAIILPAAGSVREQMLDGQLLNNLSTFMIEMGLNACRAKTISRPQDIKRKRFAAHHAKSNT